MSPDEIERTIQFLLNHQAQFSVDLEKLTENVERLSGTVERLSGKTDRIADGLIGLTSIVGQVASVQERTDQQLRETAGKLDEHIRAVESHLDVVVTMFERHLRDDHGHDRS